MSVRAALQRAGAGEWQDLHLRTECLGESGRESVTIFGGGAAVWRDRRQFRVERTQIQAVADLLQEAGFARMREVYGGKDDPKVPGNWALRVSCLMSLTIDGHSKQVTQLDEGYQEETFKELARNVIAMFEEAGRNGVGAQSLQDALEKIAAGELAPETLSLLVNRKPESPSTADGWLLRVKGSRAETMSYQGAAPHQTRRLWLSEPDAASLASLLARGELGELPNNLYAEHYTDLVVEVLNYKKSVQARQFARLTPTTHGEKQQRFDTIFDGLRELHLRVLDAGE